MVGSTWGRHARSWSATDATVRFASLKRNAILLKKIPHWTTFTRLFFWSPGSRQCSQNVLYLGGETHAGSWVLGTPECWSQWANSSSRQSHRKGFPCSWKKITYFSTSHRDQLLSLTLTCWIISWHPSGLDDQKVDFICQTLQCYYYLVQGTILGVVNEIRSPLRLEVL